jgi:hypothetical protein
MAVSNSSKSAGHRAFKAFEKCWETWRTYHAPPPFRQHHPFVKQKFRAPIQNAPTSNTDCKPNNEAIEYSLESIDTEFSGGFYNTTISRPSASDGGRTGLIYDVMI